jgi:hypothetical protein
MTNYKVVLSDEAALDFNKYIDFIIYECDAPKTAEIHFDGIWQKLDFISKYADAVAINPSVQSFGTDARRINYKKIAIIYSIYGDIAYIHRIIAQSLITEF